MRITISGTIRAVKVRARFPLRRVWVPLSRTLKEEFKTVDYVYVSQFLCGCWAGLKPHFYGLPESTVGRPRLWPGLETTMADLALDKIVNIGVGLVPRDIMYEGFHSHLGAAAIDGVKVDFIHYTWVLGAFNCQGGGWSEETRSIECAAEFFHLISKISPKDIEWKAAKNPISIEESQVFALYFFQDKKLLFSKPTEEVEIALEPFSFELVTVSLVTILPIKSVQFAPIGLVNMLNTGGAIQSLNFDAQNSVEVGVRGSGEFRAFASEKPRACLVDGKEVDFEYEDNMVVIQVPWPSSSRLSLVKYTF